MKGWKKKNWETIGKFGRRRNDRTSPGSLFAPARSNNSIAIPFIYAVGIAVTVAIFHRRPTRRWSRGETERKERTVGRRTGGIGSISFWLTRDVETPRACKTLCSSKLVSPRGGRWIAEEEAREKREKSGIRVFSSSFVSGTIEAADGGSWKQPPRN